MEISLLTPNLTGLRMWFTKLVQGLIWNNLYEAYTVKIKYLIVLILTIQVTLTINIFTFFIVK